MTRRKKDGYHLTLSAIRKRNRGSNLVRWRQLITAERNKVAKNPISCATHNDDVEKVPERSLTVVNENKTDEKFVLQGRRVIDVDHFVKQLQALDNHGHSFGCKLSDMEVTGEKKNGLKSTIKFRCLMCGITKHVTTFEEKTNRMDINKAVVMGFMTTGGGYSQLEEVMSVMHIPVMSNKSYIKTETELGFHIEKDAKIAMEEAALEEKRIALEMGDVDVDGIPLVPVAADGSWAKRSYRSNYSSLSGLAAIIGYRTKKVIFLGIKNKFCTVCVRSSDKTPRDHLCFKNWDGSSSAMESSIITDGFKRSEEMYGIRYNKIVADGDSSVYHKLVQERPYKSLPIEKIECKNHLLRNACVKIKELVKNRKSGPILFRKNIGLQLLKMRTAAVKAVEFRRKADSHLSFNERIGLLRSDITNIPNHTFGDHSECASYFCNGAKDGESNSVPAMKEGGIWSELKKIFSDLGRHSSSLIQNLTSNCAEEFNAIVAKMIGGKRINFTQRGSYQRRCLSAVISHNSRSLHSRLHKNMYKESPDVVLKNVEMKKKYRRSTRKSAKKVRKNLLKCNSDPGSYGPLAHKLDLEEEEYNIEKQKFLCALQLDANGIKKLERETAQSNSQMLWLEERRKRLTSSNFGTICKKRRATSCAKLVSALLYDRVFTQHMKYGKEMEPIAMKAIERKEGVTITPCGLFVDADEPYLGTTPDGLSGTDTTIEVKCPFSFQNMTIKDAIKNKKVLYLNEDLQMNKNHNYYYQIQGQLHITKRKFCLFGVWTKLDCLVIKLERDDDFWEKNMKLKLREFYFDCILPELIDPRRNRSLPLREPEYVSTAKERNKKRKAHELNDN